MALKNNKASLLCYFKLCASFFTYWWIQIGVTVRKCPIRVKFWWVFRAVWPWNLTDHLENYRAPLLCYFKLCAAFHSHWWIQTWVTVRKHPIWVKFYDFKSCVTLKFDGWSWKTIGHLFFATSSFVQHLIAIGEFKLELQSGNTQSGSNLKFFSAVWPWYLTGDLEKQ